MHRIVALQTPWSSEPIRLHEWTPSTRANPLNLVSGADPKRAWLDLYLANGQRVRCRPLRWNKWDARSASRSRRPVHGRVRVITRCGKQFTADPWRIRWTENGSGTVTHWRPV